MKASERKQKMIITELLERNARLHPSDVSLVEINPTQRPADHVTWKEFSLIESAASEKYRREMTWKEFDVKANRIANLLLSRGIKKGDKVVKVKDCSKWSLKYGAIAFGTKKDLSDLPNMACFRLTGLKKSENCWEVTLRVPVTRDYPAGTAVRNHRDGAAYRYVAGLIRPGKEWKKISCTIQGILREGLPGFTSSWRVGTAQAGVIIFPGTGKADVEVRNLSVSEVK